MGELQDQLMTLHILPPPSPRVRPQTIGFLTPHNARDRRTFSGTPFHAVRALEHCPDTRLHLIGNHRAPGRFDRLLRRSPAQITFDATDLDGLDLVIGMVATPLLDRVRQLRPDLPFVHVTDATPAFLRDVYGWAVPADADAQERRVAAAAAACVYSSDTIARRAAADLGLADLVPHCLPFGANFEAPSVRQAKPSPDARIELLFVGIDWARKGGDVAVAALECLLARGHAVRLTIVGRCPERHRDHPAIRAMGFLDKNRQKDAKTLLTLYQKAHLLVLPTRADCAPMVIAEAMAQGTPVLATDTGGIANQIGGQGAGRLLPPHTAPEVWATSIEEMTADPDAYAFLADAAFDRAETVLSWSAWAEGIVQLARQLTRPRVCVPNQVQGTGAA